MSPLLLRCKKRRLNAAHSTQPPIFFFVTVNVIGSYLLVVEGHDKDSRACDLHYGKERGNRRRIAVECAKMRRMY
jgi:hypothetical protein